MGLFGNRDVSKLESRLLDVEARLAQVETSQKNVRSEWEETFEKVMNALRRLGKRARDAAESDGAPPKGTPSPATNPVIESIMQRRAARLAQRRGNVLS